MEEKTLINEKISVLMRKYSIPCIISLLVGALYNIVDQIFIANASYLGSFGNAANTVVFPMTVFALGIAVMIGDGSCAFISKSLGGEKKEEASKSVGNSILLSLIFSIIITIIYLVLSDTLITLFGGMVNQSTYNYAKEYFFWITLGIPFYIFGQAMNPIIRSDGSPRFAMIAVLAGAVTNIILDPIFIFPLKMGMQGAAIATVIGQIVTAVLSVIYLFNLKSIKLTKKSFKLSFKVIKEFISLGITSFLAQISLVISMAVVQNMCTKYGAKDEIFSMSEYSQIPLAVLGIVMKFFQIAISISIGLSAGCIPIVGYNIGAKRKDRAKILFKYLLLTELLIGFIVLLIVELFPNKLILIFGSKNESKYYTDFAIKSFRIYLCLLPFSMMNKGTFIYLQALGKAVLSSFISFVREIVFGVCLVIIMPIFMGLDGVLWSFPMADFLTLIIVVIIIKNIFKELNKE